MQLDPLTPTYLLELLEVAKRFGWGAVIGTFYSFDEEEYHIKLEKKSAVENLQDGLVMRSKLAEGMLARVAAYKKYLDKMNFSNVSDLTNNWEKLPIMDKDNYLRKFNEKELVWDNNEESIHTLSVSSGTSGKPYFWPRGAIQEVDISITMSEILRHFKLKRSEKTLVLVTFSMGMYIAGLIVSDALQRNAQKNYNLSIVTPGPSMEDFISIVKSLLPLYSQVILAGYPPLVKDLVVESINHGVNWKEKNVKIIFAAESFSERWRDHIHSLLGVKDAISGSLNIYGSADAGVLGSETPLSNFIRQLASNNEKLNYELFGDSQLPSLVQYRPSLRFFENVEGQLIFSALSGYPLLRYNIKDSGGVIEYDKMMEILCKFGYNAENTVQALGHTFCKLPFVYLFGRSDFTASLYGLNIYPEHIKAAIESNELIKNNLSGKFLMTVENDAENYDQVLTIHYEMNPSHDLSADVATLVLKQTIDTLVKLNSEYRKLREVIGEKSTPKIVLHNYGDSRYFKVKIKQNWSSGNSIKHSD